ncbi:hypothetical protein D3C87_791740 [compost metagenome]
MADPNPQGPPQKGRRSGGMACEACQKPFPSDFRYCPYCARTLREHDASLEDHLGMGLPARFNWKLIVAVAIVLIGMTSLGVWRLSQIPATVPPDPAPRAAQTQVEERFASDLAKLGFAVRYKGSDRVIVEVPRERWTELRAESRFARHALVGDFRRAMAAQQRDLNDDTEYRIEVRDAQSGALLAEETDFNLKVYE